jgi:uncharacterized protein
MRFEPVSAEERLRTLDVLRGAALLGILLMNILIFGMPFAAYSNPNVWGGKDAVNLWTLAVQWVFFEGKMRALFSIMFGAGIVVFMQRATARDGSVTAADLYVRRMLWLMLFGALHGWLIWHGDILYAYALCGLLLFPLRTLSPKALFITAAVGLILVQAFMIANGFRIRAAQAAAVEARAIESRGQALTEEQQEAKQSWDEIYNSALPPARVLQEEIDDYRGGYVRAFGQRFKVLRKFNFIPAYFPPLFDVWAMMLLGMALFKTGILQGERPLRFYAGMALAGYGIGVPLNALSAFGMISSNFDLVSSWFWNAPHHVGRAAVALGHVALIVMMVKQGILPWLTARLAAVGQTALSNYIATSIICAVIFYTPGFGMMGQLQRYQLYFVVLGVWAFNLAWSPLWLKAFRFGPLEWCWRSLTYWRRQPMLRARPADALSQAGATI